MGGHNAQGSKSWPNGFLVGSWSADKSLKTKVEARARMNACPPNFPVRCFRFLWRSHPLNRAHPLSPTRRHPGVCWLATKQCQKLGLASIKLAVRWIFFFLPPLPFPFFRNVLSAIILKAIWKSNEIWNGERRNGWKKGGVMEGVNIGDDLLVCWSMSFFYKLFFEWKLSKSKATFCSLSSNYVSLVD